MKNNEVIEYLNNLKKGMFCTVNIPLYNGQTILTKEEQYLLLDCIKRYDATPSQAQAIYLKRLSQEGKLTTDKLEEIMEEEKPNQKPKYKINYDRFERYFPKNVATEKEVEDFLFKCVEEHYIRQKQKQRAMAR